MSFNKDEVLIISNHFRPIPFFNSTVKNLRSAGYENYLINNTGLHPWTNFSYGDGENDKRRIFGNEWRNYYQGMKDLKDSIPPGSYPHIKVIALVDNDCFLTGECMNGFVQEFIDEGYGFASHFPGAWQYTVAELNDGNVIQEVTNQKILRGNEITPDQLHPVCPNLAPIPYWENALQLMTRDLYDQLRAPDFSHGCLLLEAINDRVGAKMGAHKTNYGQHKIQYGDDGFIHVGAVMGFFMALEDGTHIRQAQQNGDFMKCRIGMLAECENLFGEGSLPQHLMSHIHECYNFFGGRQSCLDLWRDVTKDTVMSNLDTWRG